MIRVLPLEQAGANAEISAAAQGDDPLAWASQRRRFTPSGRAGLSAILERLELQLSDEVLITNSSGQLWISACVSSIVFNHAQPSRVVTEDTRAIVVIHEFGYPHPGLRELLALARERGIPLIEDCAHSLDSTLDGAPLGSFGDFAIFSLSKVAPVAAGGVLVVTADSSAPWAAGLDLSLPASDREVESVYREQLPWLQTYAQRRRENARAIRDEFPHVPLLIEPGPDVTPWYVAMHTPQAAEIKRRCAVIEWGSTLDPDLLLVTTNPFVAAEELTDALRAAFHQAVAA